MFCSFPTDLLGHARNFPSLAHFGHFWCPKAGLGEKTWFLRNVCFPLVKAMFLRVPRLIWVTKSELFGDLFRNRFSSMLFLIFMLILAQFWAPFGTLLASQIMFFSTLIFNDLLDVFSRFWTQNGAQIYARKPPKKHNCLILCRNLVPGGSGTPFWWILDEF